MRFLSLHNPVSWAENSTWQLKANFPLHGPINGYKVLFDSFIKTIPTPGEMHSASVSEWVLLMTRANTCRQNKPLSLKSVWRWRENNFIIRSIFVWAFPLLGADGGPHCEVCNTTALSSIVFTWPLPAAREGMTKASKQGLLSGFPTWSRSFWERCVWDSHGNVSAAFFLHELRSTFVLCLKYFTYLIEVLLL